MVQMFEEKEEEEEISMVETDLFTDNQIIGLATKNKETSINF